MFGRNKEYLDYTVWPTREGEAILAEQALGRIVTQEGVDYLDGYKLPPDNEELWDPRTFNLHITHTYEHPTTGEIWLAYEEKRVESRITNHEIRQSNIRSITKGLHPLYIKREDLVREIPEPRPGLVDRIRRLGNTILERIAA